MDTYNSHPATTISTDPPKQPAADFRRLRSEGIQWIQRLAAHSWTDHNTHDPGITILDLLCYAITDISNRFNLDIKDLLTTPDGKTYDSLYSPATVLTTNPVTPTDFKKLLLDIEGVSNAWIEKKTDAYLPLYFFPANNTLRLSASQSNGESLVIKGLYNVSVDSATNSSKDTVINRLHNSRNLCEDYQQVTLLAPQYIAVSGIVEIGQTEDINLTAARMLANISRFITPAVRFYTLAEMLAKGKTIDEIFNGPALLHGFIDDDELNDISTKTELHTSDIIREMMDEPGVLRVSNVSIYANTSGDITNSGQNWYLQLAGNKTPALDMGETNGPWLSDKLVFKKNGVAVSTNPDKIKAHYLKLMKAHAYPALPLRERDVVPEPGDYYPLDEYYSIQHHFPMVYGIGESGLPESASPSRKAAATQLKAYLLFFEQILANYHAQAAHLKNLFSFTNSFSPTYFYQPLQQLVPGASNILVAGSDERIAASIETDNVAQERQNRLLNHLISRFGESLSAYSMHEKSVEHPFNTADSHSAATSVAATAAADKLIESKRQFLANYPAISNNRGKAFNFMIPDPETDNVSGLEKRIAAKIGLLPVTWHFSDRNVERYYLLEHLLLRPVEEDNNVLISYATTNKIESFEDGGDTHTTCVALGHRLLNGEEIVISESDFYNGRYRVTWLSTDRFRIDAPFAGTNGDNNSDVKKGKKPAKETVHSKPPQWRRYAAAPNDALLVYSKYIRQFSTNPMDANSTSCTAPAHGLSSGADISITGSKYYDGSYYHIVVTGEDTFTIHQPFVGEDTGRWTITNGSKDIFSLQMTFVFPGGTGRFANESFREFVENTVREETPVHLTVYVSWLTTAMLRFEHFYKRFTEEIYPQPTAEQPPATSPAVAMARLKQDRMAWRASRNSLIDMLPLGISTYPLADIPIIIPDKAAELIIQYNERAVICLLYSQSDVVYKIWDEQGNLMNENKEEEPNTGTDGLLLLTTGRLTRDKYLLSIEAFNPITGLSNKFYQTISVRIGINTKLGVRSNDVFEYGTYITLMIEGAQSGTEYQLFDEMGNQAFSEKTNSNDGGNLAVVSNIQLTEDILLTIKATNAHTQDSAFLDARLAINILPNTTLDVSLDAPQVADYKGGINIIIHNTQATASYCLQCKYIDDDVLQKSPLIGSLLSDWMPGNNGTIQLPLNNLTEDLTLNILVKKNDSGLQKTLTRTLFVPVKPDKDKILSVGEGKIKAGETATIVVSNTQPGILYQLRKVNKDKTFTNIGNPVFHHRNHGIGKAVVETDLVIGEFTGTDVQLPAGTVEQTTMFNVLAIKATTRQEAEIGNIKIPVN